MFGAGSNSFQHILDKISELSVNKNLLNVMNIATCGTHIDVSKLATRHGVDQTLANTMVHLVSEYMGKGNSRLGLIADKDGNHLQPAADQLDCPTPSPAWIAGIISCGGTGWTPVLIELAVKELSMRLALTSDCEDVIVSFLNFLVSDDHSVITESGLQCHIDVHEIQLALLSIGLFSPVEVLGDEAFWLNTKIRTSSNGKRLLHHGKAGMWTFVKDDGSNSKFDSSSWLARLKDRTKYMDALASVMNSLAEKDVKKKDRKRYECM